MVKHKCSKGMNDLRKSLERNAGVKMPPEMKKEFERDFRIMINKINKACR